MKITKTALSILAIAISSSALAATSSDGQSSYDAVASAGVQNIYDDARGESARQALRSVDEALYAGIKKSINDYESEKVHSNQLAMIQSSENIKFAVRETNISEMADRGTAFGPAASQIVKENYVQEINLQKELTENARRGFLGTQLSDVEISSYLAAQESTARALNGTIRDGAVKIAAEFKANENAKAISEFNALQELALKESNPAVKSLIKQAADLKLASYREAATN